MKTSRINYIKNGVYNKKSAIETFITVCVLIDNVKIPIQRL